MPPLLEDSSQSIHFWRIHLSRLESGITYSEKLCSFVNSILEVHQPQYKGFVGLQVRQSQYKEFVGLQLFRCQKIVFDTIMRNFVAPGMWTAKADIKKMATLKEFNFNKLGEIALFHLSQCVEVVEI